MVPFLFALIGDGRNPEKGLSAFAFLTQRSGLAKEERGRGRGRGIGYDGRAERQTDGTGEDEEWREEQAEGGTTVDIYWLGLRLENRLKGAVPFVYDTIPDKQTPTRILFTSSLPSMHTRALIRSLSQISMQSSKCLPKKHLLLRLPPACLL